MNISPAVVALVLSSSVLAAIIAAGVNILLASQQYQRDYYREVVRRRLAAYENVNHILGLLRGASYDDTGKASHIVFAQGLDGVVQVNHAVAVAVMDSLWLDPGTRDLLVELNRLLLHVPHSENVRDVFEAGATIYEDVGRTREKIEASLARALVDLHKVPAFFRAKERIAAQQNGLRFEMVPKVGASEHEA